MTAYYPPTHDSESFNCPICGVFAHQIWKYLFIHNDHSSRYHPDFKYNTCQRCNDSCYWYKKKMIVPSYASAPLPHIDLPQECVRDYNEARNVLNASPRASFALLRLCIQKLMPLLGQKGHNINEDIAALVKGGLSPKIQQGLDICRVVGNNAVHPGEINLEDDEDLALSLFEIINIIIEELISRPKKISNIYERIPERTKKAIQKRDGVAKVT